jgi:hypothetical protein
LGWHRGNCTKGSREAQVLELELGEGQDAMAGEANNQLENGDGCLCRP